MKDVDTAPAVLVGNKSDLTDRVVTPAQGAEQAKQLGIPFFETSAKNRTNIEEIFCEIARQIGRQSSVVATRRVTKK